MPIGGFRKRKAENKISMDVFTIFEVLIPSELDDIKTMPLKQVIRVNIYDWENCLDRTGETCAVYWTIYNKNKQLIHLII
jgi:hypothetical protein